MQKPEFPIERVCVVPCHSGEHCWCRQLVYASYLKDRRRKSKVIIPFGCVTKDDAERIAELINRACDVVEGTNKP